MSLHYLVKCGCSKYLANTGFITVKLLRFGVKVNGHTVATTCLLRGQCKICAGCPSLSFFVFQQVGAAAFLGQARSERCVTEAIVSVYAMHISSMNCDNFEPICHDN